MHGVCRKKCQPTRPHGPLIVNEAKILVQKNNKKTIGTREIQTACRLVLTGELAKHAVSEGIKSLPHTSATCTCRRDPIAYKEAKRKEMEDAEKWTIAEKI